jgi:PAS domain S-box-containing protein
MVHTEPGMASQLKPGESVRVLHVDADSDVLDASKAVFEGDESVTVATETDAAVALERLGSRRIDCVVSGYRARKMDGLAFLSAVRDERPAVPFVLFTGETGEKVAIEAIRAGATDYVRKDEEGSYELLADRVREAVDRHRNDDAAAATGRRYAALLEHSRDVITVIDKDGTFRYVSPGSTHAAGYEPADLVGENAFQLVHPDDRAAVRAQFEAGTDNATIDTGRIEYRFRGPDGEYRWFASIGSSEFDGSVGGYVVSSREVTERKKRERELQQYETILQTIPDGVLLLDEEGKMIRVNDAWADTVGFREASLEGEPFQMLIEEGAVGEGVIERYLDLVRELLHEDGDRKGTFTTEVVPPDADREHVYEAHIALLPFEDQFRGTAGVVRDVTEKVRRRRELERQNDRLERFASVVSHDLRNPLNIAKAQAEMIRSEDGIDRVDDLLETLERMADLIDDVLALARQGRVVDDPDPVELGDVVENAADQVGFDRREASLSVVDDLPMVMGDRQRLRALFENLFVNAVEHGSRDETGPSDGTGDSVEVRVGTIDDRDVESSVRGGFFVADDGPGIPPEERDRVFEVGYTNAEDGTGFGLNIVREIVEAHDWSIRVTEGDGGGARFEVTNVQLLDRTDPPRQYE